MITRQTQPAIRATGLRAARSAPRDDAASAQLCLLGLTSAPPFALASGPTMSFALSPWRPYDRDIVTESLSQGAPRHISVSSHSSAQPRSRCDSRVLSKDVCSRDQPIDLPGRITICRPAEARDDRRRPEDPDPPDASEPP